MNRLIIFFSLVLATHIHAFAQSESYQLDKPTEIIHLPEILHEISGLTMIDNSTLACVQDELGIVFFYNMDKTAIMREIHFEKIGDFEGITEVGNSIFILRSDGHLTEIVDYQSDDYIIKTYNTDVPAKDNEGLCYDAAHNRLLIGSKSKLDTDKAHKDIRAIFEFNLKTKELTSDPVIEFDVNTLMDFATKNNIVFPTKVKKTGQIKEGKLKFKMSAIAIHPLSRKLYLISAQDYLLFVFDKSGNPEYVEKLDSKLFNKAEGITFLDNGDMLITNEGQDHKPTLLRFEVNKKD